MNNRVRLTIPRIQSFTCSTGKSQTFLWDTASPCLAVRATPTRKTFIFESRFDGKTIRTTIGDVAILTIEEARQRATEAKNLVDQGIDPRLEKKRRIESETAERQERKRQDVTLGEVWQVYCEARRGKWSKSYYSLHQRLIQKGGEKRNRSKQPTIAGPLYPLAETKLSDLTSSRISKWLEAEAPSRQTQTRISFESLRACLHWCADHDDYRGLADPNLLAPKVKKEHLASKNTRDDCLQREQLPVFFKSTRSYPSKVMRTYIQAVLLTGARREEVAALRWVDVDFKWQTLTINGKTGQRTIPLTPYVATILNDLPRKNQWVFSSPTAADGRMTSPTRALQSMMARAEIEGLTIHGLRRSFSTLAEWLETPAGIIAQIQGHQPSAIAEKHYKKRPLDLLRMWHVKIEAWILEQAGIERPTEQSETVPLKLVVGGK